MNTASDQAGNSNLTVTQAAQSIADLLDVQEPVDSEGEAQEASEQEAMAETEDEEQVQVEAEADAEDSEDEADSETEVDDDQVEEQPVKFTVKVDGKEIEVTQDELIRGYQREADYTRKTQRLAEERKAFQSEAQAIKGEREQYAQVLGQLQQRLQELTPPEPNWAQLEAEDPLEYTRQWTNYQRHQQQLAAIQGEQARLNQIKQAEYQQHLQTLLTDEAQKLVEKVPQWKDAKVANKEREAVVEYGLRELGFTSDEISKVTDHRAVVAIYKAMKYDQLMANKPQAQAKLKNAPRMATPGSAGTAPRKVNETTRAKQRLAQTGSVRDAAALFDKFI
jgi:hypothetical protein